jgi:hypothetical protein
MADTPGTPEHTPRTSEWSREAKAEAAFRQAATKVVRRAKQSGTPIIVWDDGEVRAIEVSEELERSIMRGEAGH